MKYRVKNLARSICIKERSQVLCSSSQREKDRTYQMRFYIYIFSISSEDFSLTPAHTHTHTHSHKYTQATYVAEPFVFDINQIVSHCVSGASLYRFEDLLTRCGLYSTLGNYRRYIDAGKCHRKTEEAS